MTHRDINLLIVSGQPRSHLPPGDPGHGRVQGRTRRRCQVGRQGPSFPGRRSRVAEDRRRGRGGQARDHRSQGQEVRQVRASTLGSGSGASGKAAALCPDNPSSTPLDATGFFLFLSVMRP